MLRRVAHYGELAPECIKSYYKYGIALLNKAQEEADPLGAMPKKDAESRQGSFKRESAKNSVDAESSIASVSSNVEHSASSNQQQSTDDGNSISVSLRYPLFSLKDHFSTIFSLICGKEDCLL